MAGYSSGFRFQWNGTSIATQLEAAIEDAMDETADAAKRVAQEHARVDTGEMRDSIEAEVSRVGASAVELTLSVGTDHGLFNELGTSQLPAQPMIRPAIDQEGPRLPDRIRTKTAAIR
jgi:HK97 gp10 family phage protein